MADHPAATTQHLARPHEWRRCQGVDAAWGSSHGILRVGVGQALANALAQIRGAACTMPSTLGSCEQTTGLQRPCQMNLTNQHRFAHVRPAHCAVASVQCPPGAHGPRCSLEALAWPCKWHNVRTPAACWARPAGQCSANCQLRAACRMLHASSCLLLVLPLGAALNAAAIRVEHTIPTANKLVALSLLLLMMDLGSTHRCAVNCTTHRCGACFCAAGRHRPSSHKPFGAAMYRAPAAQVHRCQGFAISQLMQTHPPRGLRTGSTAEAAAAPRQS